MIENVADRYPHEPTCRDGYDACDNPDHPRTPTGYNGRLVCQLPEDDGTMPDNVQELRDAVIGRRIVKAENGEVLVPRQGNWINGKWDERASRPPEKHEGLILTLDDGTQVLMEDDGDCCAYTRLEKFWHNPQAVDHAILGVGTEDGYETWHIYADLGDVLTLTVGWSPGNPFYYGYGFDIRVIPVAADV